MSRVRVVGAVVIGIGDAVEVDVEITGVSEAIKVLVTLVRVRCIGTVVLFIDHPITVEVAVAGVSLSILVGVIL